MRVSDYYGTLYPSSLQRPVLEVSIHRKWAMSVVLNLSKFTPRNNEMMLKTKEIPHNGDVTNGKSNMSVSRKIWPLPGVRDQEEWSRETCLQQMIIRPGAPRSRNLLRPNGLADSQQSIDNDNPESFHCAISAIMGVAGCFGLLPVTGVRTASPRNLKFSKFSLKTIYAVAIIAMALFMEIISVIHMIKTLNADTFGVNGGIAAATAGAIFYGNGLLGALLFMWLAPRWPSLQRDWRSMERVIDSNKYQAPRLRWKFSMIIGGVMIFALVEHLLSIVNNIPSDIWTSSENSTFGNFLQLYAESSHAFILSICDYNLAMGIFIFIISKISTFTWNFTDVFVMMVSTGLAERYKTLNQRLVGSVPLYRRNVDWREVREAYAILSSLVKRVDHDISPIILLSFANNLYFICLQLLNGLSPGEMTILSTIYFFGSFGFLVGRTIAVTLLTARINDQSRLALPALYNCPSPAYDMETQRLLQQLSTDDVCLTGMRFFSITRNFMLAVAGAIVTYEVVLLQFNVAMNK